MTLIPPPQEHTGAASVEMFGFSKRFGALQALDDVSMKAPRSRCASARFSATDMPGTTVKCWKIMPRPRAAASRGLWIACSRLSTTTLPLSAR
jgi:hypothetical protein